MARRGAPAAKTQRRARTVSAARISRGCPHQAVALPQFAHKQRHGAMDFLAFMPLAMAGPPRRPARFDE